jgi:NAD-dependent histone deacetylase SIR2
MGNKEESAKNPASDVGDRLGDVASIARYIKSEKCKNVFLMLGAGISTSAGIPDFRSPDTGLYANLARLNLPYPEAVFEIGFFRGKPEPFYALAQELYPDQFRPTLTHSFIKLLSSKSLLHTCFTQNIDTLERRAGVPAEKIIEAHGSFATQRCIECRKSYDAVKMKKVIMSKQIPRCETCRGLVKPDIVFFGESLPTAFHKAVPTLWEADLLIVIGTSLTVHPFASLAYRVPDKCQRVLINLDLVGDFGNRTGDIICLGKCDDVVRDLARELGWEEELLKEWEATAGTVESEKVEDATTTKNESEKQQLQTEVDKLASEVEKSLAISETSPVHKEKQDSEAKSSTEVEEPVLQIPNAKKEEKPSVSEAKGSKILGSIETKPEEKL